MAKLMADRVHLRWRICWWLSLVLDHLVLGVCVKTTSWPLHPKKPLVFFWNAPTEECGPRHGVHLQLDLFQTSEHNLTVFYKDRLGRYPHFTPDGTAVNGGLPQSASLTQHREKMPEGIRKYIPDPSAAGLAVIDWEEWRPLWSRNWDVYKSQSRRLVAQKNPNWTLAQANRVAQQEFEMSSRIFMLETLRLARSLRPHQLWGFHLFPDCYNHDYRHSLENYTGRCPDVEVSRNEQLKWLWTESSALYPSVSMSAVLRSTASGRQFVRNRVKEGMRLASVGEGAARPVFVYTRPTYVDELEVLTETDLVSTIGESVALGVAGIIFGGDDTYASSFTSCSGLDRYLSGPLGRYLLNVSTAAEQCSHFLCASQGRCLRRRPDSDTFLHLDPQTHTWAGRGSRAWQCQCYSGFHGDRCELSDPLQQRGEGHALRAWRLCFLSPLLIGRLL